MKRVVITILLLTIAVVFAQTGKTIRVAQSDVIVIDKLPITLVVNGDTLVLGDIGVQDADKKVHMMLQKKCGQAMHFSGDDKEMRWFTVTDTEESKGEKHKKIKVQIESDDDDVITADDKKIMVWVDEIKKDAKILECKDGKNIRVQVLTDDDDEEDAKVIICEEKKRDSADTTKNKEREFVIIKKLQHVNEAKEERKIILAVDDKEIRPVIGLGILLKEKEGQLSVDKILEKVAPKDQPFKEGDQILKMEGKEIKSFKDFAQVYDVIESGKKVKATVKRENGRVDLSFTKPSEKGKIIYIQTKEK